LPEPVVISEQPETLVQNETQPVAATQIDSLDLLITEQGDGVLLDTQLLEQLELEQSRRLIQSVSFAATFTAAFDIQQQMAAAVTQYQGEDVYLEESQCSDKVCTLLFQANSEKAVSFVP
jgi:hypothetical protein